MATVRKHQSQRHTANQQSQRKPWYMETMAWIEMHQLQQTTMIHNARAAKNGMLLPVKPEDSSSPKRKPVEDKRKNCKCSSRC